MSCISEEVAQAQDSPAASITARLIRDAAEHMRWTGQALLPAPGMLRTWLPLGAASLWAEYELLDDQAIVQRVLINGQLLSAEDWIPAHVLAGWEEELWSGHKSEGKLPVTVADLRRAA